MRDVTRGPAPTEHDARPLGKRPDQLLHYDDLRVPRPRSRASMYSAD